jgi:hypothetical protein
MAMNIPNSAYGTPEHRVAAEKLMGLVVFGEKVAARNYVLMGDIKPEFNDLMRKFASMEGQHSTWFRDASLRNDIEPNKQFADGELGYLIEQVERYHSERDFDAIAVVQGFIVECLAIATYEPFLSIAHQYEGAYDVFKRALEEERYHVDWVTRYLRLRFFDAEDDFVTLAGRVNVQGIDCVGGTLMNVADSLNTIGLSAADCTGAMMDEYTNLLERIGIDPDQATRDVVSLFVPLVRKYRHGETAS